MPSRTPAKEAIALGVLLVLLVVVVIYQMRNFGGAPGGAGNPAQARRESSRVATARDRASAVPELKLSALHALAAMPAPTVGRNPFREKPVAPPVLPGRLAPGTVVAPPGPPPPLPPPPITLRLVAIVRGAGRPLVGLATEDNRDVFYGREGDIVEGRYRIIKVNVESIDISYVDGRGQRRIGLTR